MKPGSLLRLLPACCLLGACAVPATRVEVDTMSMEEAFESSRAGVPAPAPGAQPQEHAAPGGPRLLPVDLPKGAPLPLLSTPEVRMAYLYEWIDAEGNHHFGEWVAIALGGFHWIMRDGTQTPLEGERATAPRLPEAR